MVAESGSVTLPPGVLFSGEAICACAGMLGGVARH